MNVAHCAQCDVSCHPCGGDCADIGTRIALRGASRSLNLWAASGRSICTRSHWADVALMFFQVAHPAGGRAACAELYRLIECRAFE